MLPLLSARALTLQLAERQLFAGVDLQLAAGEMVALSGPSGTGKSSLLRALCALVDVQGQLYLGNQSIEQLGFPLWRRRVNYVPQTPSLAPTTVADNLSRPARYRSADTSFDEAAARDWLARLGLNDAVWTREAPSLSVGEQQRVCLVRSLSLAPRVLLLDEPTAALDADATARTRELLREWVSENQAAALVVTHENAAWVDRRLYLEGASLREVADD